MARCDFREEESDPVDDETDEDEHNNNNEISKVPSNSDAFSALEIAMELSPPGGNAAYKLLPRSINRQVTNRVAKNDANLALSPTFRYVSIESPLYRKERHFLRMLQI
ncbi:hypothetical protein TNCV_2727331 [Trichonephila clavipes]|nr:hypothetical protein TNCV_2727331 [Trichonephila clavipes]